MNIKHYEPYLIYNTPTALTVGMFDGVHKGHQLIISALVKLANNNGLEPSIATFSPHPQLFFNPNSTIKQLTLLQEKAIILEQLGIKTLFILPFNTEIANTSAKDFVSKIVSHQFNAKALIMGYDNTFGKNKEGNYTVVKELAEQTGINLVNTESLILDGVQISSTKIRLALLNGEIELANLLLGYNYNVTGTVEYGKQLGSKIGIPTANVRVDSAKLVPKNGVYVTKVYFKNKVYSGITNIGIKPTVSNANTISIETHILNFSETIYNQEIKVEFVQKLRDEQKFNSLQDLVNQIHEDIAKAEILAK